MSRCSKPLAASQKRQRGVTYWHTTWSTLPQRSQKLSTVTHGSGTTMMPVNAVGNVRAITTGMVCPTEYPCQMRLQSWENRSAPATGSMVQSWIWAGTVPSNTITNITREGPESLSRLRVRKPSRRVGGRLGRALSLGAESSTRSNGKRNKGAMVELVNLGGLQIEQEGVACSKMTPGYQADEYLLEDQALSSAQSEYALKFPLPNKAGNSRALML